jgi:hypothetical protein
MYDGGSMNRPPTTINGMSSGAWMSDGMPVIIAKEKAISDPSDFLKISTNGSTVLGRAPSNPFGSYINVPKLWTSAARRYMPTDTPAEKNASLIWPANQQVSASVSDAIFTEGSLPRSPCIRSHCSWFNERGCNLTSSSALARSASAARAFASRACVFNSATISFDRRCNSPRRFDPIALNRSSPNTPMATRLSAMTEPHIPMNESNGGCLAANPTSIINPRTIAAPHHLAHVSHDDAAPSSSPSLAFITPFLRRHAGNGSLVWLWSAVGVGVLISVLLFVFVK